jgi:hypothetical protein
VVQVLVDETAGPSGLQQPQQLRCSARKRARLEEDEENVEEDDQDDHDEQDDQDGQDTGQSQKLPRYSNYL